MLNKEIHNTALGITPGDVHFSLGFNLGDGLEKASSITVSEYSTVTMNNNIHII